MLTITCHGLTSDMLISCEGDYKNAIRSLEYSYIVNPDFKNGYLDCAELCCQIKDYKKALVILPGAYPAFGHHQEYLVPAAECMLEPSLNMQLRKNTS
jgi:hypothetical protein